MGSTILSMNNLDILYQEVLSHYQSCQIDLQYLSDTWVHTLEQKGRWFPQEEMMYMRAPGNRVNSWMIDTTYMIDHTSLDLDNPYIRRLLEIGENDFGHPRKDMDITLAVCSFVM